MMNQNNIKKLLELFNLKETVYKLSNNRIAQRNKVSLEEVYEAKKIFKEHKHSGLLEHCREVGVDFKDVNFYWHKSKKFSMNVRPETSNNEDILESFDNILEKYSIEKVQPFNTVKIKSDKALNVVLSDEHVGLDPNPKGNGLFSYEYNAEIYKQSMEKVFNSIVKEYNIHGAFEEIYLNDLGDGQDGWDSQTTRGGHRLQQNMTNGEMFDTYVDTKVRLIESIVNANITNKVIIRTLINSNHSADFALVVNKAIEKIVNRLYSTKIVEMDIIEKFIDHRYYGDNCLILTHGKDANQMKYGLPLILNDKTIKYFTDYIDFYEIKSKYIHVLKGDLHQLGFQKTNRFTYRNFMSFAPPSNWVQHNFGNSYAGYSIQVIPKNSSEISHTDYFLDYKKIKS
jgi:hypothetical protein